MTLFRLYICSLDIHNFKENAVSEIALSHHETGIAEEETHTYTSTGTSMGKVFMWLFLCQDALMFMGLFAAYISVRIGLGNLWPSPANPHTPEHYPLDINLTAINTFILICSSVTMVMAVQAARSESKKGLIKWLFFTMLGGAIFLGVQVYEYRHLIGEDGMGMEKSLFDATFFGLTGFHGLHVFSGVIYLLCVIIATKMGPKDHSENVFGTWLLRIYALGMPVYMWLGPLAKWPPIPHVIVSLLAGMLPFIIVRSIKWLRERPKNLLGEDVEVLGLYWHFVDLIWIILFTLVYLI
jgi:heme/copper-type cytochrome/quinol oxidase subunit 3